MSTKIVIADDHMLVQQGFCSLLKEEKDFELIGGALTGREAVRQVQRLKPDIVIMDVAMPELNGVDATQEIIALVPNTKILAVSMYSDAHLVFGMLKAGARGFLLKSCVFDELVRALKAVLRDEIYLCPRIARVVVQKCLSSLSGEGADENCMLTAREREVVQLLAEGWSNEKIADHLHVSSKTVSTHRRHIQKKLGLGGVAEITKYAIRHGLTTPQRDLRK